METSVFYRAKAIELHGIADRAVSDADSADWRSMARTWDRLAVRTEAEDRLVIDGFSKGPVLPWTVGPEGEAT